MPSLVSPEALKMMSAEKEVNIAELRDSVAANMFSTIIAHEVYAIHTANETKLEQMKKGIAKISFDFAEAFMRERYERTCVKASMQSPSIPDRVLKGNTIS